MLVQNDDGDWGYFSTGNDYVKFVAVDADHIKDLETFNNSSDIDGHKYYGYGYSESVYIKGDFADAYDYYESYYNDNKTDSNKSAYNVMSNNCSTVVMNGIKKGKFWVSGDSIGDYIKEYSLYGEMGMLDSPNPKSVMTGLQTIFYNSEFTFEAFDKTINDQLWEARNGKFKLLKTREAEDLFRLWNGIRILNKE